MSDYLTEIIQTWDSNEHFDEVMKKPREVQAYKRTSWYCMLSGMGRFPKATIQAKGSSEKYIQWLRQHCADKAEQFYSHSDYLQRIYGTDDRN